MQDLGGGADLGSGKVLASGLTDERGFRWDYTLHDGWFEILLKIPRELRSVLLSLGGGVNPLADRKVG